MWGLPATALAGSLLFCLVHVLRLCLVNHTTPWICSAISSIPQLLLCTCESHDLKGSTEIITAGVGVFSFEYGVTYVNVFVFNWFIIITQIYKIRSNISICAYIGVVFFILLKNVLFESHFEKL